MATVRHFKVIGLLEEIQSGSLTNSQNNNDDHYDDDDDETFYRTVCSEIAFEAALSFSVARLS